jgi:hypothetical protein
LQEMTCGGRQARTGPNWAQASRPRPADPPHFLARFMLPFDLGSHRSIYSSCLRWPPHPINQSTPIHQKPPPQDEG